MLALRRGWGLPEDFKAEIPLTLPEEFKAEMVKRKVACAGAETWCYGWERPAEEQRALPVQCETVL